MTMERSSGVLLHPTSLPGPYGVGELGRTARLFVRRLSEAGQRWWQILPFHPTGFGGSPYSALSAFAGHTQLIDLESLCEEGWLTDTELDELQAFCTTLEASVYHIESVTKRRAGLLAQAFERWFAQDGHEHAAFTDFCANEARWLDDFALFMALKREHDDVDWRAWPTPLVERDAEALAEARIRLSREITAQQFYQWQFFGQWQALREEAAQLGVAIIGDLPIFVAMDSADVWANRAQFLIEADGSCEVVAGVPPDYFSKTGQKWGNPLYDWAVLAEQGYDWWVQRVAHAMKCVDLVRIDHFRAFDSYWEVPVDAPTAEQGVWSKGPGDAFFSAIREALGEVPFIAEDLGIITQEVTDLRIRHGLPGMKVMQFAFDGNPDHPFLPHTYPRNAVAYTGTHDNDTTQGWYNRLSESERHAVRVYLSHPDEGIVWAMIRSILFSDVDLTIFPVQDLYELGTEARMNVPGTAAGNWTWRMTQVQLDDNTPWLRLKELSAVCERSG